MSYKFDYNLIKTLVLVYEMKSMSKAAQALGVSAPTLTYSLNKIRDYYNDPLFIKTTHGLQVTSVANSLYPSFKKIDNEISKVVMVGKQESLSVTNVIIRASTLVEYHFMNKVTGNDYFTNNVSFEFNNKDISEEQRVSSLISRAVDIDIGVEIIRNNYFITEKICDSEVVALCRNNHPRIGDEISQKQWLAEDHVAVTVNGVMSFFPMNFHDTLEARNIRYKTASVLNALHYIENSDFIMLMPSYFIPQVLNSFKLRNIKCPWLANNMISMYAYIHRKAKNDEKLKWVIEVLKR